MTGARCRQEQPKVSPDTSTLESAARGGTTVKREVSSTSGATPERADDEPPEDFIVTHCDWEDCGRDYEHQADLVKVSDFSLRELSVEVCRVSERRVWSRGAALYRCQSLRTE